MTFRCDKCGATVDQDYWEPLPRCSCRAGARNRGVVMYPNSLHAMKVWMMAASERAAMHERMWRDAIDRMSKVDDAGT